MIKTFSGTIEKIKKYLDQFDNQKKYEIKIDDYRIKRSLQANNYAWVLIGEIAEVLMESKEQIYFRILREYGQSSYIYLSATENPEHHFKYFTLEHQVRTNKALLIIYKVYRGTSTFNSKEMSVFINGLHNECRDLGIETQTDKEIKLMIEAML